MASMPSEASAMTSNSSLSLRNAAIPSRTRAWSSAIRTLFLGTENLPFRKGDSDIDSCPESGLGTDLDLAADERHPFFHAEKTEPPQVDRVIGPGMKQLPERKSLPIILDLDIDGVVL